jgi:Periplasmic binding protein
MRSPPVGGVGPVCGPWARNDRGGIRLSSARSIGAFGVLLGLLLVSCSGSREAETAIRVGLIAPLSGYLAPSGEAIQRGMLLAIDEVNREGGALGRPLALLVDDVENDPRAWRRCRNSCNGTGSLLCSPARSAQ